MKLRVISREKLLEDGYDLEFELHPDFKEKNYNILCRELFKLSFLEVREHIKSSKEIMPLLEEELFTAEERIKHLREELKEEREQNALNNSPIR